MTPKLAKTFYEKYTSARPWADFAAKQVPKLTELCISLIGKDEKVVDILFHIYGADTNFPISKEVTKKMQQLMRENYFIRESSGKLALLFTNKDSTHFVGTANLFRNPENLKSRCETWNTLIWAKLTTLAADKITYFEDNSKYSERVPEYNFPDAVLACVAKFKNLQTLYLGHTVLKNQHFKKLAGCLPNLKVLYFEIKDNNISDAALQALAQLKHLEELYLETSDVGDEMYDDHDNRIQKIISRCLKFLPHLKVVGRKAHDNPDYDTFKGHMIPKFEKRTVLGLEHLQIWYFLKKECSNSSLTNVKSLGASYLNDYGAAMELVQLKMKKLEELYFFNRSTEVPMMALISGVGLSVTLIDINDPSEELDFLRIIDLCKNLKQLAIDTPTGRGHYNFGDYKYLKKPHAHLQHVCVELNNPYNAELPRGALERILAAPKLETLYLGELEYPKQDCQKLINKLQSTGNSKIMQEFTNMRYWGEKPDDIVATLFATMAIYCPKLKKIHCEGKILDKDSFKMVSSVMKGIISVPKSEEDEEEEKEEEDAATDST